jgi:hypothetical protein
MTVGYQFKITLPGIDGKFSLKSGGEPYYGVSIPASCDGRIGNGR